jgi:hypothetical protein
MQLHTHEDGSACWGVRPEATTSFSLQCSGQVVHITWGHVTALKSGTDSLVHLQPLLWSDDTWGPCIVMARHVFQQVTLQVPRDSAILAWLLVQLNPVRASHKGRWIERGWPDWNWITAFTGAWRLTSGPASAVAEGERKLDYCCTSIAQVGNVKLIRCGANAKWSSAVVFSLKS